MSGRESSFVERASTENVEDARSACEGCGYMIRGGSVCGDCLEYGPPRGWLWEYDPATDSHEKVARPANEVSAPRSGATQKDRDVR